MNIQQLEYILAVDREKSFGRAADACAISQSTLSTMVLKLEEELGVVLFDRKTKPISPTREGKAILQQAAIIVTDIANLRQQVKELKGEISGELNVGVIPTVAPFLLPLFLGDFLRAFPDLHLRVSEVVTRRIIDALHARSMDVGIVSTPLKQSELVEVPLYDEPFVVYDGARQEGARQLAPMATRDLDKGRLWLLEEGHCLRTQALQLCGAENQGGRTQLHNLEYQSGTIDTLKRFVRKNQGMTLLPFLASLDMHEHERRMIRPFAAPIPARQISLVHHKHFVKQKVLEELTSHIRKAVRPLMASRQAMNLLNPM